MKIYIKIVLVILSCLASFYLKGQNSIQVITTVLPPYSLNIADYRMSPERIAIKLINTSNADVDVQLGARFESSNGVLIKTKDGFVSSSPITVQANGVTDVDLLTISQLFDLNSLDFEGFNRAEVIRTGILPEGDYQLCIRAYNYSTLEPVSAEVPSGCSNLIPLYGLEPPVITNPISESSLPIVNNQNVIFNWTIPPGSPPQVQYTLLMVEIQGNANPNEAILSNGMLPFYEQTLGQNILVYGADKPALIKDKKYAVRVTAEDPINKTVYRNNGNSEVIWFTYGEPGLIEEVKEIVKNQDSLMSTGNCGANCAAEQPTGDLGNANVLAGDKIFINDFAMTVLEVSKANGKLTGKGTIPVPFINASFAKLRVEFKDIDVNTERQLINGNITAIIKSGSPSLMPGGLDGLEKTLDLSKQNIMQILNFINNDPMQKVGEEANKVGFELPLGITYEDFNLAVTAVVFTPVESYFSLATVIQIPENNDHLALTAAKICMDGSSSICGSMELYLAKDFNIDPINLKLIGMKNEGNNSTGTFMKLRKNDNNKVEVTHFHVKAEFVFPPNSLINAKTKEPLLTTFEFDAKRGWHDWKAELTIPEFYVDGVEDVKFDLAGKTATLDHSDLENPLGLPSPYKSSDNSESDIPTDLKTWHGLYFPLVQVTIPDIVKSESDPNKSIKITGQNLIFTSDGFTGLVQATDIISIGDGSLAGWYASVDKLKLDFWKSTFKSSSLNGRLVLPPCGSEVGNKINQLDYTCLLTNPADKPLTFQFTVVPKNDMQFRAFYAKVNINQTSQIIIKNRPKANDPDKMEFYAQAKLDGLMGVTEDVQKIPGIVGVSIPDLMFTNFQILTDAPYINADEDGVFKLNSPPKKVAGFTYNLSNVKPIMEPGMETKVGIKFTGNLNLIGEKGTPFSLAAEGKFGIFAKVTYTNNRFSWEGIGARVEDISLGANADLGAIKLTGALKYYNQDNPSDCGFVGALAVKLPTIEVGIGMKAQFGISGSGASSFEYFNLEAMADFGTGGIPLFTGVNLYGLGGGVSYNMQPSGSLPPTALLQNQQGNAMTAATDKSPIELLNYSPSGQKYKPSKGSFALSATALFGLVSRNTLDADATFTIAFNENGGLRDIKFNGECRILTDVKIPMPSRNLNSLIHGNLDVSYDFERDIFNLGVMANLNFPYQTGDLINAKGQLDFYVSPQGWFLHVGRPQSPAEINLVKLGGNSYLFNGQSYFETGTYNIDPMPDIPDFIRELAGSRAGDIPRLPQMPRGNLKGFIHGAQMKFDYSGEFLFLFGQLKAGMGYDISLLDYGAGFECGGIMNAGANGWYAMGQAYFGVRAVIGMDFGSWFGKIKILEAGSTASIMAGLPNPSWAKGCVTGDFSVLDGLFSGGFSFKFEAGTVCEPKYASGLDFTLISEITPGKKGPDIENDIEVTQLPTVAFNFSVNKGNFTYYKMDSDGKRTPKYYKFDRSTINIQLVGGGEVFGMDKFVTEPGKPNSLIFKNNTPLKPNTEYTITVTASIKEALSPGGDYNYIKDSKGKELQEVWTYRFKTNKGLKKLDHTQYVNSYPIHSHPAYIDHAPSNRYFIELDLEWTPLYFDTKSPETAKIYANIYKNDVRISNSLVTIDGKKWTFAKFPLDPSANYRVEFEFRVPENIQMVNTTSEVRNFVEENRVVFLKGTAGNQLKAQNEAIGYFRFTTSAFKTYKEKFENQKITDVVFRKLQSTGETKEIKISSDKTQLENLASLEELRSASDDNSPGATYSINCPNNTTAYHGEQFNSIDYMGYTPNTLFKYLRFTPGYPNLMTPESEIDNTQRMKEFIVKSTGISSAQLELKVNGIILGPCGDQETISYSFPNTSKSGSVNNLPIVPDFITNFYNSKSNFSYSSKRGSFDLSAVFAKIKPTFQVLNFSIGCSAGEQYATIDPRTNFIGSVVLPPFSNNLNNVSSWGLFSSGIASMANSNSFSRTGIANLGSKLFR